MQKIGNSEIQKLRNLETQGLRNSGTPKSGTQKVRISETQKPRISGTQEREQIGPSFQINLEQAAKGTWTKRSKGVGSNLFSFDQDFEEIRTKPSKEFGPSWQVDLD